MRTPRNLVLGCIGLLLFFACLATLPAASKAQGVGSRQTENDALAATIVHTETRTITSYPVFGEMTKQYGSTLDGILPDPYLVTTLRDSFEADRIQDFTLNYSGSGTCAVAEDYFIECTGSISFLDLQWYYTFTPEASRGMLYEGAAYDFAPDTDFTLIYNFPNYLIYITADPAPDLIEAGSLRWQRPHTVDFETSILFQDARVQVVFLPLVAS